MNIVYFGTPPFAAAVLAYLIEQGIIPRAVVTQPDRPQGRGEKLRAPAVKAVCQKLAPEIPIFQPDKASAPDFAPVLEALSPDLFVVVAYGELVKQHLLDMPKRGCINLHASLLPKYRGAAPIQRCIMAGELESGVTVMHMVMKMDAGDIIATESVPISEDMTAGALEGVLCERGKALLTSVIREFEKGEPSRCAQDPGQVTYAPKLSPEDGELLWEREAQALHDLVRGVTPRPGAWCALELKGQSKRLKILRSRVVQGSASPSELIQDPQGRFLVGCGRGILELVEVQLEGKRVMSGVDFMRGYGSQLYQNKMKKNL